MRLLAAPVGCQVATVGLCLALLGRAAAQVDGSLKNLDLGTEPTATSVAALLFENADLKRRLSESESSLRSLQLNFGNVSNEVEVFRRKSFELNARIESFGTDSADERVIKLLNELRIAVAEKSKSRDALVSLTEVATRCSLQIVGVDSQTEVELRAVIQEAEGVLGLPLKSEGTSAAVQAVVGDSLIVSIKEDVGLIVLNVGLHHGARLGMPFEVLRNSNVIGTIRIVDVRDKISGALIQNLSKNETAKVGDHLRMIRH